MPWLISPGNGKKNNPFPRLAPRHQAGRIFVPTAAPVPPASQTCSALPAGAVVALGAVPALVARVAGPVLAFGLLQLPSGVRLGLVKGGVAGSVQAVPAGPVVCQFSVAV